MRDRQLLPTDWAKGRDLVTGRLTAEPMDRRKLRGVFAFFIAITAGRMLYDSLF